MITPNPLSQSITPPEGRRQVDCPHCYGNGEIHSAGRNGDPDDPGVECPICKGACIVDAEEPSDEG